MTPTRALHPWRRLGVLALGTVAPLVVAPRASWAEGESALRGAAPSAAATSSAPAGPGDTPPVEVTVRGNSAADRRRHSAEAVRVVELEHARRESADLGEVLARTEGVGVRREGGLGSATRFSLNGLTDDQVRFLLDGVPLELAGYPFGVANVPVNLVERVEIYSGVVPGRFAADALGGAVNLVTDADLRATRAVASYGFGSFGTHRLTGGAQSHDEATGLYARVNAFFDAAENDYPIDVKVADERGRLSPVRVRRFHDAYRATGGNVELGVLDRPWARRLAVRAFITDYDKEYQHNVVMSTPYGGVTYGETSSGGSLRYEQGLARGLRLELVLGYAFTRGVFVDVDSCFYDWYGRCVRERVVPGETDARPHDQVFWDDSGFARLNVIWHPPGTHELRLAFAPTYLERTGDEYRESDPTVRDPLTAERRLLTLVSGLEHELTLFERRLENVAFVRSYAQRLDSEEPRPGGAFKRRDRDAHHFGAGDALRYLFVPWLYGKLSYERATRLPRADEVFGDNAFVAPNLELLPEQSHNANAGVTLELGDTPVGAFRASLNGFFRDATQLIVLLGSERKKVYQNVVNARSVGLEGALGWTAPGDYLALDLNGTYQDFRNHSKSGFFKDFSGDRIPNRPYLFANATARLAFADVATKRDQVSLTWASQYVHEFFLGWESLGDPAFKPTTPTQFVHGAGLEYLLKGERANIASSIEVQNVTDELAFDFYGVQQPGRALFVKTTAEL